MVSAISLLLGCSSGSTLLPTTYAFAATPPQSLNLARSTTSHKFQKFTRLFTFNSSTSTDNNGDLPVPATAVTGINGASKEESQMNAVTTTNFDKLRKVSNVASILCVIDCTVLPIVTIVFPLLGIFDLGPEKLALLHQLGHSVALFFVLPVGSLTSILNFMTHKKARITSLAVVGLTMIGLANSHIHHVPLPGFLLFGRTLETILHTIQHGALHSTVNIMGCSMLLGSNYLSQQQGCAFHDHSNDAASHDHANCDHDHSH